LHLEMVGDFFEGPNSKLFYELKRYFSVTYIMGDFLAKGFWAGC